MHCPFLRRTHLHHPRGGVLDRSWYAKHPWTSKMAYFISQFHFAVDHYAPLFSFFVIGVVELVCVSWWWPCMGNYFRFNQIFTLFLVTDFLEKLSTHRNGERVLGESLWTALWKFVTPSLLALEHPNCAHHMLAVLLVIMTLIAFIGEIVKPYGDFPVWSRAIGWIIAFIPPLIICAFAIFPKV